LQEKLTITQRQVLSMLKASQTVDAIATGLKLKTHQVIGEWTKIYLLAQSLRTAN
nr:hypothetical protein [Iningainema tapete BLCC-T55]